MASHDRLERSGITLKNTIANKTGEQTEVLRYGFDQTAQAIRELDATFRWEFAELLTVVGRMADTLAELVRVSKTSAQTWAYEQYEIARDAIRRKLYPDALEAIQRAINGFEAQTGYKLDYRFHVLLGTIRLGSIHNSSAELLDLPDAHRAFANAAKYARADFPLEAARAFVGAGYAAYCQGEMEEARRATLDAIKLNSKLPEAHFQMGKLNAHADDVASALIELRNAISLDPMYALKVLDDGEYQKHGSEVTVVLSELREQARTAVAADLAEANRHYNQLQSTSFGGHSFAAKFADGSVEKLLAPANAAFAGGGYVDYVDCAGYLAEAIRLINRQREGFLDGIEKDTLTELEKERKTLRVVQEERMSDGTKTFRNCLIALAFIPAGIVVGVITNYDTSASMLWLFVTHFIIACVIWRLFAADHRWAIRSKAAPINQNIERLEKLLSDLPALRSTLPSPLLKLPF